MTRQHHPESQDGLNELKVARACSQASTAYFPQCTMRFLDTQLCTALQETPLQHVMAASWWLKGRLSEMQTCCVATFSGKVAHAAHNGGSIKENNSSRAAEGKGSQQPEGHLHDALCCRPDRKIPHKVHSAPARCNESAQREVGSCNATSVSCLWLQLHRGSQDWQLRRLASRTDLGANLCLCLRAS